MAKALKYYYEFRDSVDNNLFSVEIWVEGFVGAAEELKAGNPPLTIDYNKDVSEQYLGAINPFILSLEAGSTSSFRATDFLGEVYGDAMVRVLKGADVLYNAIIVPFEGMDSDLPATYYKVNLGAECGLTYLKSKEYATTSNRIKLISVLQKCLSSIPKIDNFGINVIDNTQCYENDSFGFPTNYWDTYVDERAFVDKDCYEVLQMILQPYNELFQSNGKWIVRNIREISSTNSFVHAYTYNGTTATTTTYSKPTTSINRLEGGSSQFGMMFSHQSITIKKDPSKLRSINTWTEMDSSTGWTFNGAGATLFFTFQNGYLSNNEISVHLPTASFGSGGDTTYVQSPPVSYYPFNGVFQNDTRQRASIAIKSTKGYSIQNMRLQIIAENASDRFYLTSDNSWYREDIGAKTPIYELEFETGKEKVIELPTPPYIDPLFVIPNILSGENGFWTNPAWGFEPPSNVEYNITVRVLRPARFVESATIDYVTKFNTIEVDYIRINTVDVEGSISEGFSRLISIDEAKDRDSNLDVTLGVGYPSYPIGLDYLSRDEAGEQVKTQFAPYNLAISSSYEIDKFIGYSYLDVLGKRLKFYQGKIEGDVSFGSLISIDSDKYRFHNFSYNFGNKQASVKAIELSIAGVSYEVTDNWPYNPKILKDIEDSVKEAVKSYKPPLFIDQNFATGFTFDGQKYLGISQTPRFESATLNDMFFLLADGGTIKDIGENTVNDYTLIKPAENGTYATREWVGDELTDSTWLLSGNTLASAGVLGSLNDFDVTFKRNSIEYLALLSTGLTVKQDITISKTSPVVNFVNDIASTFTSGFFLGSVSDDFRIRDVTNNRNVLLFLNDDDTHTLELNADLFNFKDGATQMANLSSGGLMINSISAATTDTDKFIVSDSGLLKYRTGSQVLSDIGGVAAFTGLTTNYVTKWNGTTLANSLIFDNGTNVGIGTASAASKLEVTGVISASLGTVSAPAYSFVGDLNTGIYSPSADALALATGGVNRLHINNNGSVGIGTTSLTGYNLRIFKNLTGATGTFGIQVGGAVQNDVTVQAYAFYSDLSVAAAPTPQTLSLLIGSRVAQGTIGANVTVGTQIGYWADSSMFGATNNYGFRGAIASGTGRWNIYMDGTAQNYIRGNVGIGASSTIPATELEVRGVISSALGSASLPSHTFVGDLDTGWWSPAANTQAWSLGGTESMRLNATGLGIGVTPSYKLDVSGTGHFTGAVTFDTVPSSLQDATTSNHLVRYSQWIASTSVKYLSLPVKTVALTNITLSGTQTVSGVGLVATDRMLAAGQNTQSENGVYVVSAGAWTRATDSDTDGELRGYIISITNGTYASYKYINTNQSTITVGTTAITYAEFSNLSEIDPVFVAWRDSSRSANTFWAAPSGSNGVATWRALTALDIPTLNQNTTGSAATLTTSRNISISGDLVWNVDFNGGAAVTAAGTLATVNANIGQFTKVTVNAKGLVTAAENLVAADIPSLDWAKITTGKPTTLAGYGITDFNSLFDTRFTTHTDLVAIEALAGTSGFLKKTATNTWSLDTSTYLVSSDLSNYVDKSTNQTVGGVKTFSSKITVEGITIGTGGGGDPTNTAVGGSAGGGNSSGLYNSFLGVSAGAHNTTGSYNVFLGSNAGRYISGGATAATNPNFSIFIGANAYPLASTNSNQIVLGYNLVGQGSNTVSIGNSSITANFFNGSLKYGTLLKPNNTAGTNKQVLSTSGTQDSWVSLDGSYISNWASKQDALSGTGFVKIAGTTITYDSNTYLTALPSHTLDSHSNVTITSNSAGEILKWSGAAWINNTLAEAGIQGTITSVGVLIGSGSAVSGVVGTASQLLRRNSGNTAYEFFTHDFINQAGARSAITLSVTGSSGASTYNSNTGALNIPTYTLAGLGGFSNPMTTLGDVMYGISAGVATRLAGNTTTTKKFLSQTGNGTISAAPTWDALGKGDVGLGNVENTAISTWAGTTNITTLGTITTGVWGGTTITISKGGTGLTSLGTANQLLRVSSGVTALEYFTPTWISGNQTITLSGDVTGSGATAITTAIASSVVTGKTLTGYALGSSSTILATDTILGAFGKVQAQINTKQATLSGTGLVMSTAGTISYVTNSSANWNTAFGWGNHSGLYVDLTTNQEINGVKTFSNVLIASGIMLAKVGAADGRFAFHNSFVGGYSYLSLYDSFTEEDLLKIYSGGNTVGKKLLLGGGLESEVIEVLNVKGNISLTGVLKPDGASPSAGQFFKATSTTENSWSNIYASDIVEVSPYKVLGRITNSIGTAQELNGDNLMSVIGTSTTFGALASANVGLTGKVLTMDNTGKPQWMGLDILPPKIKANRLGLGSKHGLLSYKDNIQLNAEQFKIVSPFQSTISNTFGLSLDNTQAVLKSTGASLYISSTADIYITNLATQSPKYVTVDATGKLGTSSLINGGGASLTSTRIAVGNSSNLLSETSVFNFINNRTIKVSSASDSSYIQVGKKTNSDYQIDVSGGKLELTSTVGVYLPNLAVAGDDRMVTMDATGKLKTQVISVGGNGSIPTLTQVATQTQGEFSGSLISTFGGYLFSKIGQQTLAGMYVDGNNLQLNSFDGNIGASELILQGGTSVRLTNWSSNGYVSLDSDEIRISGTKFKLKLSDAFGGSYTPSQGDKCTLTYDSAKGAFVLQKLNTKIFSQLGSNDTVLIL